MKHFLLFIFLSFFSFNLHAQYTNVLIDNLNDPNEPSIAINPLNPNHITAGSNPQNSYYSNDGGATWINGIINSTSGGDPCLVADSSGNFYYFHMIWGSDRIVCQKSSDGGVTYNTGSFAWNNNSFTQDKEWATFDPFYKNLYVAWTQYDYTPAVTDSSRIFFAKSSDFGNSFTNAVRISTEAGDINFHSVTNPHPFVGPNGEVYVTFVDSIGIRFNRSLDTGNTWLTYQPIIENGSNKRYYGVLGVYSTQVMPYSCCDISNSPYRGNLYVSWSDQRNGNHNTDVFFIKSTDGGNNWTSAMKVNTDSSGNHQYRNAMAVDQTNGYIYIAYYDRRNYVNNDSSDVYISKSIDGGTTWTDIKVSDHGFFYDFNGLYFDGDYIDIAAHAGIVRPIWTTIGWDSVAYATSGIWTCIYNESTSGIEKISSAQSFSVNPNPANALAVLSFLNESANMPVIILDTWGRIVLKTQVNHQREKLLDLSNLSSGVYYVKASSETRKLIIEK